MHPLKKAGFNKKFIVRLTLNSKNNDFAVYSRNNYAPHTSFTAAFCKTLGSDQNKFNYFLPHGLFNGGSFANFRETTEKIEICFVVLIFF
jgi:hypothetical protein